MTARTIYLVRHAQPRLPDKTRRYLGQSDPGLSPAGMAQARELAEKFKTKPISEVFCSDLLRALQTCRIIGLAFGLEPVPCKELRELNLGEWEGLAFEAVRQQYPEEFQQRGRDMVHYRPPGGESFLDLSQRVLPAFGRIVAQSTGDIVIVAHAGVNRMILCHVTFTPLESLFTIRQDYCRVSVISFNNGLFSLESDPHQLLVPCNP